MNAPEYNQPVLLKLAIDGDDEALTWLIESFRSLLRHLARQRLHGGILARLSPSDVVNITWWQAFRSFPGFQGNLGGFQGWLCGIHERVLIDALRKHTAAMRNPLREERPSDHLPVISAPDTSPSERAIRNERDERLYAAIQTLSPLQKEAVRLRYWHNQTIVEIAEHFQRTNNAVSKILQRAAERLHEILKEAP